MTEEPVLLYLHIPKTAGQTLNSILSRQYQKGSILQGIRHPDLAGISPQEWSDVQCVAGHVAYGAHEYLGDRPYRYITILRDPVDRIISLYYYVKRTPDHRNYQELVEGGYSVKEMVERKLMPATTNHQTALLAGMFDQSASTQQEFERACDHLENHFDMVGLTEEFDRSILLLQQITGWSNVYYISRNVTQNRIKRQALDEDTLRVIREHNELDLKLYEIARARFANDTRAITQSMLGRYQVVNRLRGLVVNEINSARNKLKKSRRKAG